jgi:hypothetical protein
MIPLPGIIMPLTTLLVVVLLALSCQGQVHGTALSPSSTADGLANDADEVQHHTRSLHAAGSQCLVAQASASLMAVTNYTWGGVSVAALSHRVLAVTVTLGNAYAFQVVSGQAVPPPPSWACALARACPFARACTHARSVT